MTGSASEDSYNDLLFIIIIIAHETVERRETKRDREKKMNKFIFIVKLFTARILYVPSVTPPSPTSNSLAHPVTSAIDTNWYGMYQNIKNFPTCRRCKSSDRCPSPINCATSNSNHFWHSGKCYQLLFNIEWQPFVVFV